MISDDERREVARKLRVLACTPDEIGITEHAVIRDLGISSGIYDDCCRSEEVLAVADLIDRPTCHDVADFDRESFKCSRCGFRVLSIDGASDAAKLVGTKGGVIDFGYCPNCGAVVVEEGGCDVREL